MERNRGNWGVMREDLNREGSGEIGGGEVKKKEKEEMKYTQREGRGGGGEKSSGRWRVLLICPIPRFFVVDLLSSGDCSRFLFSGLWEERKKRGPRHRRRCTRGVRALTER